VASAVVLCFCKQRPWGVLVRLFACCVHSCLIDLCDPLAVQNADNGALQSANVAGMQTMNPGGESYTVT
jgi:hypothetical protein